MAEGPVYSLARRQARVHAREEEAGTKRAYEAAVMYSTLAGGLVDSEFRDKVNEVTDRVRELAREYGWDDVTGAATAEDNVLTLHLYTDADLKGKPVEKPNPGL